MSNYDELFTASTVKNESKQERPFNKEEWVAKKQQERAEAFEMLDAATTEAVRKKAYLCKRVSVLSPCLNPVTNLPVRTARRAFPSM